MINHFVLQLHYLSLKLLLLDENRDWTCDSTGFTAGRKSKLLTLYTSYRAVLNYTCLLVLKVVRRCRVSSPFDRLTSVPGSSCVTQECRHNIDMPSSQTLFHLKAMSFLKEDQHFFYHTSAVYFFLLSPHNHL